MAYSRVEYTGDGSQTNFTFSFPYLSQSHVLAHLDGVETEFTWVNASTIQFSTAPAAGVVIEIFRETPREERLVDFTNGAIVNEDSLDTSALQAFYLVQESLDSFEASLGGTSGSTWDAQGRRIINLADPVDDQDAAPRLWVEEYADSVASGTGGMSGTVWTFTGNAFTTTFPIEGAAVSIPQGYLVSLDGSLLRPDTDYTVDVTSGEITFTEAPGDGLFGFVWQIGFQRTINEPAAQSVDVSKLDPSADFAFPYPVDTPVYVSGTEFSFVSDAQSRLEVGRRLKVVQDSGTQYVAIEAIDTGTSTVTVKGGTLANEAMVVWVSAISVQQLPVPLQRVVPQMFGAVGDGTTDDTAAFLLFAAAPYSKHIPSGTYVLSEQITFDQEMDITFGDVTLNFSAAATAGDFPDNACVFLDGGDLTALPDLSGAVSEGDNTLALASAPSLAEGDVFLIYNPTDSSYSGHRTVYRAGEFCRVLSVSDSTVKVYGGVYADYAVADVSLYKLEGRKARLHGLRLHIVAPGSLNAVRCLEAKRIVDSRIDDVSGSNSGNAAVMFAQCYNVEGHGLSPRQAEDADNSTDYGLVIANCQKIRAEGDFYGRRHSVILGGEDETGVVPNRDIRCVGSFSNDPDAGAAIAAVNAHGNSERYHFEGTFNGGINPGGDFGTFKGHVFVPAAKVGMAVYFGEMLGWSFDLSGLTIVAHGDPDTASRGTIDLGGNSPNEANDNTIRGGILDLSGIKAYAPDSNRAINIYNRGSTPTDPIVVDLRGTKFTALASGLPIGIRLNVVSGDTFDRLWMDGFYLAGDPAYSVSSAVSAISGYKVSGLITFSPDTGANQDDVAVVFPRKAPKLPHVTVSYSDGFVGAVFPVTAAVSITTTGFTARLATPDATNFASATARTAYYTAVLDE